NRKPHWLFLPSKILSWGCTAGPRGVKAQQPGAPLSSHEYRQFFRSLRAAHRATTACHLRALYGCQNPLVRRLDEYENHGAIPKGKANCDSQGQADGWGSCRASAAPQHWEGMETREQVGERGWE
uniref:Acrosin-binding protein n=1 Tax=Anser brachyrhynchus TaxID=132585 RepID=A0A8B9CHW1_9AVES